MVMKGLNIMRKYNQFVQKLGLKHPIIQAGMAGGVTTPELVAAVSNSGALGTLGAGYMTIEQMNAHLIEIKKLTSNHFGVNLFVPEYPNVNDEELNRMNALLKPFNKELGIASTSNNKFHDNQLFEQQIELILDHKVSVCSFTFGVPSEEIIQRLKRAGTIVIGTATTVEEALINEKSGMDAIVVQGSEAGGHRGAFNYSGETPMIGTMSLIPQVVDQVNIPVIAAGGIADGRGVLAALVLGAQAVQIGTAFVTCDESGAHPLHKKAILNSKGNETVLTSVFSGKPARGIKNEFIEKMEKHKDFIPNYPIQNALTSPIRKEAAKQGRSEWMSLWAGQSSQLGRKKTVNELITRIFSEIDDMLEIIQENHS
jgi:nitronate monooxygenase